MMVVLGIDVHKATHTAVAVDEVGRQIAAKIVAATDAGHRHMLAWALQQWAESDPRFAVEDTALAAMSGQPHPMTTRAGGPEAPWRIGPRQPGSGQTRT